MSVAHRLSLVMLVTAAGWLALRQANLPLTQIQQYVQGYGIEESVVGFSRRG